MTHGEAAGKMGRVSGMIKLVCDTFGDFRRFWAETNGASPAAPAVAWEAYAQRHANLFAASGGRLGGVAQLTAAMPRYARDLPRMNAMRGRLPISIVESAASLCPLFDLESLPVRWALAVGTYWSDGWVCELGGQPTMVLALEMLESTRHAQLLLAHELAHLAHARAAGAAWDGLVTLGDGLLLEGLAVAASAQVVPGEAAATYLWCGISRTPAGEPLDAWLAQCDAAWLEIQQRLRRDLLRTDSETIAAWFHGDAAAPQLPVRVGYAAGFRLVSRLAEAYPIAEMARWDSARVTRELLRAVEAT
ncbi:MAG: hypothetical protein KC442_01410 [Thermomicrobiales bacterium]|nr:hypothetical protein [Thermomicrobiales bacterium]